MNIPLLMGIAYALVAALLLNLNLASPWRREIKLAAIILVTGLYVGTYIGAQDLRGWAIATPPENPFKLHWAVIEEPDKVNGTAGRIYILAQPMGAGGALRSSPRLHGLPFSAELADAVEEALEQVEDGKPFEARLAYKKARPPEEAKIQKREGASASEDSAGDRPTLKLEFRDLPVPDLPPKGSAN
jgi:hypothetical protein